MTDLQARTNGNRISLFCSNDSLTRSVRVDMIGGEDIDVSYCIDDAKWIPVTKDMTREYDLPGTILAAIPPFGHPSTRTLNQGHADLIYAIARLLDDM